MKRCTALILCLLLFLGGCSFKETGENLTAFYYCRTDYVYGDAYGVVAPELREVSAGTADLKNLLSLYLVGPLDEGMASPFRGFKLISAEMEDSQLVIELVSFDKTITDARFSLACACMTMTCLELTQAEQVTILCGDRSVTMHRDNLLLLDTVTSTQTITEETQ